MFGCKYITTISLSIHQWTQVVSLNLGYYKIMLQQTWDAYFVCVCVFKSLDKLNENVLENVGSAMKY